MTKELYSTLLARINETLDEVSGDNYGLSAKNVQAYLELEYNPKIEKPQAVYLTALFIVEAVKKGDVFIACNGQISYKDRQ